jgi:hypothetical protein
MLTLSALTDERVRTTTSLLSGKADKATYIRRSAATARLQEEGFPVGKNTLERLAARGEGPPFQLFVKTPLYKWWEVRLWAERCLRDPSSEASA